MRVTDLQIYPVKSLAGDRLDEAVVEPWGLAGDRRWALVDEAGEKVTAREEHALLGLRAEQIDEDTIRIHDRDGQSIPVETPLGLGPVPVSHARQGFANPADEDVNWWIAERVGRPLRLVWQEDPAVRRVSGAHGGQDGDVLSLADAGPLLLTSRASLTRLREWIGAEWAQEDPDLSMLRFRPNVVIDGDEPFAEDGWSTVRLGGVEFRTAETCDRCVMATIHPEELVSGKEPTATLARHRRWGGKTWFGTRLVPMGSGSLRVGDEVAPGLPTLSP
ncbi:MOSC domain-containing protein [Ornithinimicrobium cryptoxanthini]|uniref:MOSC domain-containing protein n=1 Tax=Ornithinimicrobium cryptoxanthini TaxID=2934161 RepID=A0ABY4YHZ2_9MICO|nr:MOSC N-terminal beta barrel domain-containing protein [Ornithinimicrobium cryptoxanthini]USQ76219.1 MOSC domain-containing protein [Ornithinimicrobium cryptoxanthini]